MAVENFCGKGNLGFPAAADLRTKQYYFVVLDSNGKVAVAGAGLGDFILLNKPNTDEVAEVAPLDGRLCKVVVSAALNKGDKVTSDASGKAKAIVTSRTDTSDAGAANDPLLGSNTLGILVEASSADGDIVTVYAQKIGAAPATAS